MSTNIQNKSGKGGPSSSSKPRRKTSGRDLVLNAMSSWGRHLAHVALLLVLTPFMLNTLGQERYGVWALVLAVTGVLELLDLGLGTAVVRLVAELKGKGDVEREERVLGTVMALYMALGALLAGLLLLSASFMGPVMDIPESLRRQAFWALIILGTRSVIGFPASVFRGVLHAHGMVRHTELARVGTLSLYALGVYFTLTWGWGVVGLASATLFHSCFYFTINYFILKKKLPHIQISPLRFHRDEARRILRLASAFLAVNVGGLVATRIDSFVLQWVRGLTAVALYALAARLADNLLLLTKQFIHALSPGAAEMAGRGDEKSLRILAVKGAKFSLMITVPAALGVGLFARPLISAWVGPQFAASAGPLAILAISVVMSVAWIQASGLIAMTGEHKYDAIATLGSAGFNLAITVPLAWWLGIHGAALGTLTAATVVGCGFVIPRMLKRTQVSASHYLASAVFPSLLPVIPAGLLGWGLKVLFPPTSLFAVALEGLAVAIMYLTVFAIFGLDPRERALIARKLQRLRPRGRKRPEPGAQTTTTAPTR